MASVPTTPIHSMPRPSGMINNNNPQKGALNGIEIRAGTVQVSKSDIDFDLKSGTANVLIAQRAGTEGRKSVATKDASRIREDAENYVSEQLGDLTGIAIQSFRGLIKDAQKKKRLTSADAREIVEQCFEDPSLQHGALLAIAHMESQMGDNDGLADMLKKLAQNLMEEQGPAIRAGYNINEVIALFAEGNLDTFTALREAYRATLFSDMSEEQIYDFLAHILPLRLRKLMRRNSKNPKGKQKKKNQPAWEDWEDLENPSEK